MEKKKGDKESKKDRFFKMLQDAYKKQNDKKKGNSNG